jgi:hypothetical protein
MTAALFLLIAGILSLHVALSAEAASSSRRLAIAVACIAALPPAFGPLVPISHFIFEATGRRVLVTAQAGAALLLLALAWRLVARWRAGVRSEIDGPFAGALIGHAIWLGSAVWLSDYEGGVKTPGVWDKPVYTVDWLSSLLMCGFLAIAAWRVSGVGVVSRILTAGYVAVVVMLASETLG